MLTEPLLDCKSFCNSNIKDHRSQITVTNVTMRNCKILWEIPKYETQNMTEVNKWCCKNGTNIPTHCRVVTDHQPVKHAVSAKCNLYACIYKNVFSSDL